MKKETTQPQTTEEPTVQVAPESYDPSNEDMESAEFNLEEEYKPTPLVPGGRYLGNITGVKYVQEDETVLWEVVLDENGGVCNDGETPVDGVKLFTRNWLPKVGDECEMTKDGKMNKRQAKVNMLKRFQDDMKIDMNSKSIILSSIQNQEWLGAAVLLDVGVREYEGRFFNEIKRMHARVTG